MLSLIRTQYTMRQKMTIFSTHIVMRHGFTRRESHTRPLSKLIKEKYLKEKELKLESKLISIKEFVLKENNESEGNIDWKRIVLELANQNLVNKMNFEVDLMSAFLLNNETDSQIDKRLFESINKFIKSVPNIVNNKIAASRYYYFISHFHQYIEESDIQMIRQTTDRLVEEYMKNRLTDDVLHNLLIGLSKSSKNNCLHSIKLLGEIQKLRTKSVTETDFLLIMKIIESALTFKLIDPTLDLIEKFNIRISSPSLISKLVQTSSEFNPRDDQTMKLLRNLSKCLTVFDSNLKSNFEKILRNNSFKINDTFVAQNGFCLKCEQRLGTVSTEEQNTLMKDFYSVIFNKKNDLLLKSFPEYEIQLKLFGKFINNITRRQPLDLVIDSLNVAFYINPIVIEDKKNLRKFIQKYPIAAIDENIVETLIKNNIEKYENVLIVGRNHMKKWKRLNKLLDIHRDKISVFYAMNKTQDDCYILYATLKNSNTYLISNDFYRDFISKMSQKGNLFERWLKTHQIFTSKTKEFVFPDQFDHKIHISNDNKTIHIPFQSNESSRMNWICCQKMK